jgi:hypothetical protein
VIAVESGVPRIEERAEDATGFVEYANRLLAGLAASCSAERMLVSRVDGWFDDKWLGFSGKTLGAVGVHDQEPRVPPFVAHRLVASVMWSRQAQGWTRDDAIPDSIYHDGWAAENLPERRRFDMVVPNTTGVWISSGAARDRRAAVLVYASNDGEISPFYVGFEIDDEVRPRRLKGVSAESLAGLARRGA